MKPTEIPVLPRWVALTDAAVELGMTRQGVHKMVTSGRIKTMHRVGPVPVYVMKRTELDALLARRVSAPVEAEAAAVLAPAG